MRSKFLSLNLIAIIILFGAILPHWASAATSSDILVNVAPENPAPNENTSITLNSYANNLDSVLISWSIDGKTALSGIGKKIFSLNAPAAGSETSVVATIALPDGSIDKTIIIRPNVMVLLWQANDSYTPPFYKGKAMPTAESSVKVVAMPEIKSGSGSGLQNVSPKNMTYAWKKDYNNDQTGSGYGRNSFVYTNDYLDDLNNISVVASTIDQNSSSSSNIDIGTTPPKIVFYKNDPTLGTLWEQALSDGHTIQGDEIIEAAPYFISPGDIRIPALTWDWSINDSPIDVNGLNKNLLPVKTQAGASGTSKIKLEINNIYKIFENVSKEISVEF